MLRIGLKSLLKVLHIAPFALNFFFKFETAPDLFAGGRVPLLQPFWIPVPRGL